MTYFVEFNVIKLYFIFDLFKLFNTVKYYTILI